MCNTQSDPYLELLQPSSSFKSTYFNLFTWSRHANFLQPIINKKKKINQFKASLTIVMKPELTHDEEVTVEYYEETNIEVFMVASPKPKVKW